MSEKHSAELKTPRRREQHLQRWNQCQTERFYLTITESPEVAFTVRSCLRKNEPFSTPERSERVENFLFRATREYTEAGIEQAIVAMRRLRANSPEPRKRAVREWHVSTQKTGSYNNAPIDMHYLSDIRPEPDGGLISFWYQTWGLISFWYQTCDGSGFEFVRTNYVQHQTTLQLFSTMGEASHLCRFTLVVGRFD